MNNTTGISSSEQVIKRYNGLIAFLLDMAIYLGIGMLLAASDLETGKSLGSFILTAVVFFAIAAAIVAFISIRTPKKAILGTSLRCIWFGVKMMLKVSLFFGIITIPIALMFKPKYSKKDYTVIKNGQKIPAVMLPDGSIKDNNGNIYFL